MSATTVTKGLTADPGVHYLAGLIDLLQAKVDVCCGGGGGVTAPAIDNAAGTAKTQVPASPVSATAAEDPRVGKLTQENERLRGELAECMKEIDTRTNPSKATTPGSP